MAEVVKVDLGLKDKVALIFAGSKGLGKSVALRLSEEGANVVIVSRNVENLESAKEEIFEKTGRKVVAIPGDVTRKEEVDNIVSKTVKELGALHILFANSGGPPSGRFSDFTPEDYLKAINLNLMSTIYAVYAVTPYMKAQKWGRIIASTSVSVKQPLDDLILSNVARVGVVAFIKSVANELAPYGITSNVVAPGYTLTERIEELIKARMEKEGMSFEEAQQSFIKGIPMKRLGKVEEYSAVVAFLASEEASFINGTVIPIDGGFIKGI